MASKKLLSTILKERTESIQYRKVRTQLMVQAQNNRNSLLIMYLDDYTLTRLQNEGLTVEKIQEFGYDKYRISW